MLFKIFFILVLLIAFVPPVRRFLFWLVVGRELVKEQKKQHKQTQQNYKKEGQINVDYVPKDTKGHDFKGGEYIDYEEVKE